MKNNFKNNIIFRSLLITLSFCVLLASYFILKKEQIALQVNGKVTTVNSYGKTVKELLSENNICYDENDIIYPSLDSKLEDYMNIKITYVEQISVSEHSRISYKTEVKKDKSLPKGVTKVAQEGKDGRKTIVYEEVYHDGKLVSRVADKEMIREEPVNKVVIKGTGTSYVVSSANLSESLSTEKSSSNVKGNKIVVSATAYSGDSVTATGTRPRWGTIAVDPRIIPYGTKVYIPKFNRTFVAEDCGGGIKGNRIDIFMNSSSACYNWGVRSIDIYIVG